MKRNFKKILLEVPGFERLCRLLTRRHVRVFMYHKFSCPSSPSPGLPNIDELKEQLQLIQSSHTTFSPDQQLQFLKGTEKGYCPVVLTVDDGYADFWEVAFPVFSELGIPVMLFVTTGFVSGDTWFWWDRLRVILDIAPSSRHSFFHRDLKLNLDLRTPAAREQAWHLVADKCRFMPDSDKELLINKLASHLCITPPSSPPEDMIPVTWDQIREMAAAGIHFGTHTVNHPILTRIHPDAVDWELAESQNRMERELGHPVTWFCYPQGGPADYNQAIRDQAARYFSGAYVAFQDPDLQGDFFTLPRYGTSNNLNSFRWNLCGAEYLSLRIKKLLGLKTGVNRAYWQGSNQGART